jgi:phosphoribosyl 1,2-cyclic phosphodiesterase
MFFTHVHHDHVQGWPFFIPAYIPTTALKIYGERNGELGIKEKLSGVMVPPYFPVTMDGEMKANMEFFDVGDAQTVSVTPSLSVTARRLNHPNGALGYRVESVEKGKKRVFTFVTDTEHTNEMDQNVVELAREADAFAYDSAYIPKEFENKKGWGHSTWQEGVRIAKVAKAKRFVIFHHEPTHTDRMMTEILKDTRAEFKRSILAHEGLELSY